MNVRELARQIVRRRVRSHLGLLSEAVLTQASGKVTVNYERNPAGQNDRLTISVAGDAPGSIIKLSGYKIKAGASGKPEKDGNNLFTFEKTRDEQPTLDPGTPGWFYEVNPGDAAGVVRVSWRMLTQSGVEPGGVNFRLPAREAATAADPASDASAGSAALDDDSAPGTVGGIGRYEFTGKDLILTPRETGVIVFRIGQEGSSQDEDMRLVKGQPVTFSDVIPAERIAFFKRGMQVGDLYDIVAGESVKTYQKKDDRSAVLVAAPPMDVSETPPAEPEPQDAAAQADVGAPTPSAATPTPTPQATTPTPPAPTGGATGPSPQTAASTGTIQDRIMKGSVAVPSSFDDVVPEGMIKFDEVRDANPAPGHTWIRNTDSDRQPYNFQDWSPSGVDRYTYFALINDSTRLPIAFVVASDPEDNDHYSTGRFIGPESKQYKLRRAFCILYHRATGEVYEGCDDRSNPGPEDDVPLGSGKKRSRSGSRRGSDGGAGGGPGDLRVPADVKQVGGGVTGRGDVKTSQGPLGISYLDPYEKARKKGKKFVTKTMNEHGWKGFPASNKKGQGPRSIAVFFNTSVVLKSGAEPHTTRTELGEITKDNILKIKYGFAGPDLFWTRFHVIKRGDPLFDRAADWVLSNQEQFNLLSDNDEDEADQHEAEGRKAEERAASGGRSNKKGAKGVKPDVNRGETTDEGAVLEARARRSLTPLLDRYRF